VANFLQRWFGASELPAHLAEPLEQLAALAKEKPSLERSCNVLEKLLVELFGNPISEATVPAISLETAQAKWAAGTPLLRDISLRLDESVFRQCWLAVCAAMQEEGAESIADAACEKKLNPIALLREVLAGRVETIAIKAEVLGIDAAQLGTVLRLTSLPVLARVADACAQLRRDLVWEHGYCPICGSWPLLAESRGLEQVRIWRCGLCASAWEGSRFRCAFCGNDDHRKLGYCHVDGEEARYRIATCDECRGYVKVITTLSPLSPPQLLVSDLAMLHLDLIAAQRGFSVAPLTT
jgi:FdhE protein